MPTDTTIIDRQSAETLIEQARAQEADGGANQRIRVLEDAIRSAAAALTAAHAARDAAERERDEARHYLGRDLAQSRDRCVDLEIAFATALRERDEARAAIPRGTGVGL